MEGNQSVNDSNDLMNTSSKDNTPTAASYEALQDEIMLPRISEQKARADFELECSSLFRTLDVSKQGHVSQQDVLHIFEKSFASLNLSPSPEDLRAVAKYLVSDNGKLSYEDFKTMYKRLCDGEDPVVDERHSISNYVRASIKLGEAKPSPSSPAPPPPPIPFRMWFQDNKLRIIWLTLYTLLNVASFSIPFVYFLSQENVMALSGPTLAVARGAAQVCLLNIMLLMLCILRAVLRKARLYPTVFTYIPLDDNISFHKICGYVHVIAAVVHTVCQVLSFQFNVLQASEEDWEDSALANSGAFASGGPTWKELIASLPGWTGIVMAELLLLAIPLTFARKKNFNWFWFSHMTLYTAYISLFIIHGIKSWLWPTQAWFFAGIPFVIYGICRVVAYRRILSDDLTIVSASFVAGVLALSIEKPKTGSFTRYVPGMYLLLNIPGLSYFEWHPFTISSAPHEEYLTVHIDRLGDWTGALHDYIAARMLFNQRRTSTVIKKPVCRLDGPYGAPAQAYLQYDIVVLIAGGIGVTPFASILKDLAFKYQDDKSKKVYFHWSCRDPHKFTWFKSVIDDISAIDSGNAQSIEIINHWTTSKGATADNLLPIKLAQVIQRVSTSVNELEDLVSGTSNLYPTSFGRPNWDNEFSRIIANHPSSRIGVFFCGNASFEKSVREKCKQYTTEETKLEFHAEHF